MPGSVTGMAEGWNPDDEDVAGGQSWPGHPALRAHPRPAFLPVFPGVSGYRERENAVFSGQARCHAPGNAGSGFRSFHSVLSCGQESSSPAFPADCIRVDQSAAVPFGNLFFWVVHSSFAILITTH